MRSGCREFESRSGHLTFSSICSVYIIGISELTSLMMNKMEEVPRFAILEGTINDFIDHDEQES